MQRCQNSKQLHGCEVCGLRPSIGEIYLVHVMGFCSMKIDFKDKFKSKIIGKYWNIQIGAFVLVLF